MRSIQSFACAGAFLCAAAFSTSAMAERPNVGKIDKVQRQAEAVYQTSARPLADGAEVIHGDSLQTGDAARLQSTLVDGTQLTLGENATLVVDEYVYDPTQSGGKMALDIVGGAFLFVGGQIEGETGGNVEINTPVGTLGVRGTTVWGGAIDGGYGVLVLDGMVTVTTEMGSVDLQAGQATMVYRGGKMEDAHAWPKHKIDKAVRTISFE